MKHKDNKKIIRNMQNKKINNNINKAKDFFLRISSLPAEVIENVTKMTVIDNCSILIEGYKNVEEYYTHYIKAIGNKCEIIIDGESLDIDEISNENLLIKGNILSINFRKI